MGVEGDEISDEKGKANLRNRALPMINFVVRLDDNGIFLSE